MVLRNNAVSPKLDKMLGVNSGLTALAAAKRSLRALAASEMEIASFWKCAATVSQIVLLKL